MRPLYKVSGMSRDNVVRTRYFHYVYDLSTCLHVRYDRVAWRGQQGRFSVPLAFTQPIYTPCIKQYGIQDCIIFTHMCHILSVVSVF